MYSCRTSWIDMFLNLKRVFIMEPCGRCFGLPELAEAEGIYLYSQVLPDPSERTVVLSLYNMV